MMRVRRGSENRRCGHWAGRRGETAPILLIFYILYRNFILGVKFLPQALHFLHCYDWHIICTMSFGSFCAYSTSSLLSYIALLTACFKSLQVYVLSLLPAHSVSWHSLSLTSVHPFLSHHFCAAIVLIDKFLESLIILQPPAPVRMVALAQPQIHVPVLQGGQDSCVKQVLIITWLELILVPCKCLLHYLGIG